MILQTKTTIADTANKRNNNTAAATEAVTSSGIGPRSPCAIIYSKRVLASHTHIEHIGELYLHACTKSDLPHCHLLFQPKYIHTHGTGMVRNFNIGRIKASSAHLEQYCSFLEYHSPSQITRIPKTMQIYLALPNYSSNKNPETSSSVKSFNSSISFNHSFTKKKQSFFVIFQNLFFLFKC